MKQQQIYARQWLRWAADERKNYSRASSEGAKRYFRAEAHRCLDIAKATLALPDDWTEESYDTAICDAVDANIRRELRNE